MPLHTKLSTSIKKEQEVVTKATKKKKKNPGIKIVVLLQEGGPLPGPKTRLLSNTRK